MKLRHVVAQAFAFALMTVLLASCSRKEAAWVAKANGEAVTAAQFRERYAQYLQAAGIRDNIVARKQVLDNMINERLIFQDIVHNRLDRDPLTQSRLEEIRLQAMLDEYTRNVTVDTITASEQELQTEFLAYNTKVSARYLYAKTREEAVRMKGKLFQGETFESLSRQVFNDPGLANNGGFLGTFGWGEMEPELEQAAFSLPPGTVSDPVRLKIGYALVKVETRVRQPLSSEYDYAKVKDKLARAVKERKTMEAIRSVTDRLVSDLHPVFDERGVTIALGAWSHLQPSAQRNQEMTVPPFSGADSNAAPLVRYEGGAWTVGDFLSRALHTSARQQRRVHGGADIENVARGLLARDVMLERAQQRHLENNPAVQRQISKLRDDYLLRRWALHVEDTVGANGWNEDTVQARYHRDVDQYVDPPLVNVAEILVRTRGEAEAMVRRLHAGARFADVARKYSIRIWAGKRGGELGFGSRADFGVLGEKFFAARPGQILGPEFVDPYWGVFTVLGQKAGRPILYAEARGRVVESLAAEARQAALRRAVNELRAANKVEIAVEALENVELSNETQH